MAARRRPALILDDRTRTMDVDVLTCRSFRHRWDPASQGAARRAELLKLGQAEVILGCRCGTRKIMLIDLDTWTVVSVRMEYPEGYLIKDRGSGRLPWGEAYKAFTVATGGV
jgi:hypothetical protein